MALAENQKGINAVQQYFVENQKGTTNKVPQTLYSDSTLLVLNRTSLISDNALLALK